MEWNEKLRFARKILRLSQRDVEAATGLSNAYISQIETGQIKDPGFFTMLKLISFYNIDVDEFIDGSPNEKTQSDKNIGGPTTKTCSQCGTKHFYGTMCPKCFGR